MRNGIRNIPSCYTEVQEKNIFWREKGSDRENTKAVMRVEGSRALRRRILPGPCTHAGKHSTEGIGVELYGLPEEEEQSDDLRAVWEPEIQV